MGTWFALLAKAAVIALIAAVCAWAPMAALTLFEQNFDAMRPTFSVALLGSFAIGLPMALLVYGLAGKSLARAPGIVFLIANLAGVMMILTGFVIANQFGLLFLGLPAWLAANVFAGLGWIWILKPQREAHHARP